MLSPDIRVDSSCFNFEGKTTKKSWILCYFIILLEKTIKKMPMKTSTPYPFAYRPLKYPLRVDMLAAETILPYLFRQLDVDFFLGGGIT